MANARQDDRLLFLSVSGSRHPFPVLPPTAFHPLRMRVHQWLDSHAASSSRLAHILRQHIPHHPRPNDNSKTCGTITWVIIHETKTSPRAAHGAACCI